MSVQCVAARLPRRMPAAPRTSAPEHTDAVHVVVSWTWRSHARMAGSRRARTSPPPPGTTTMSGRGTSSSVRSATSASPFRPLVLGPRVLAGKTTSAPGSHWSTSFGPTASCASRFSKRRIAICMTALLSARERGTEPAAVGARRDAERADEGAAHRFGGAEARAGGDGVDAVVGLLEAAPRRLDARRVDEARRRRADLAREHAREIPGAHRHAARERADRAVGRRVIGDPRLEVADRLALGALRRELRAELRLPARA